MKRAFVAMMPLTITLAGCAVAPLTFKASISSARPEIESDAYVDMDCHHMGSYRVWIVDGKLGCSSKDEESGGFVGANIRLDYMQKFTTVGEFMAEEMRDMGEDSIDFEPEKTQSMKEFIASLPESRNDEPYCYAGGDGGIKCQ